MCESHVLVAVALVPAFTRNAAKMPPYPKSYMLNYRAYALKLPQILVARETREVLANPRPKPQTLNPFLPRKS